MYLTYSDDNSCISMCLYFLIGYTVHGLIERSLACKFDKGISITKLAFHTNSLPIEDGTNLLTIIK